MKKVIILAIMLCFATTSMAFAATKKKVNPKRAECQKQAKAEKIPKKKLKAYMKECLARS